jgi:N-methylhydantoinase A
VVTPLDESDIDAVIAAIREAGLDTVAVSFLFSFLNDAHERRVGERLRQALPGVGVYLSCEVLPEIREFERASTTAVCAYVGPLLAGYLDRLQSAISELGLPRLLVMGSSGGMFDVAEALRMPAITIESGPAAGVIAAALVGKELGLPNLISFDMGGLHGTGHPIRVPVIDLAEVSAGGGSIAWVDEGGALNVGPKSAGADPGPAAYGRGGMDATVSDADVVLGYLDREALLGGALGIDFKAAEAAIRQVADSLRLAVPDAAARIVEIVNANMSEALRIVSIERGHDPREFALIAFGGAGPVHAAALAAELQIPEIIVPPVPGAFSALGVVASDLKRDYSRTLYADLASLDPARVLAVLAEMEVTASDMLSAAGIPPERRVLLRAADVRYRRQAYELTVPLAAAPITRASLDALATNFHEKHRQTYSHANTEQPVQLVTLRVTAVGRLPELLLGRFPTAAAAVPQRTREVWFPETGFAATPVYWRDDLAADQRLAGPSIIEALDSTIVVPPSWIASVDAGGYIRLRRR